MDREAEMIAKNMLDIILAGVRTPERPASPENAYLTDEQIFKTLNPTVRIVNAAEEHKFMFFYFFF